MNTEELKNKIKELNEKIGARGRKLIIIGVVAVILFSVIIALVLNRKNYEVLYSGVTAEEAAEIVALLQEREVDYQYRDTGEVLVEKGQEDTLRAQLAMDGYPKNAFAYSTFLDNAGGMATDFENQTYKLYELQDRIGGTIELFEGVKDAKVTIALGETQKYVLQDVDRLTDASASVVMTMKDGSSPSQEQVLAAQRLVAASVAGMEMDNVTVVDGNGIDVSAMYKDAGTSSADSSEIARMVENDIVAKVTNVLGAIYGMDNIRVSVKSVINMEELVRETLTYSTPEKIDENDKTGIVQREDISESMGEGVNGDGGVVGTESNSDITQYASSGYNGNSSYSSSSESREYAINQVKEQGQVPAGAVESLTVSVIINGNDYGDLTQAEVRNLIAGASGISLDDASSLITVAAARFYEDGSLVSTGGEDVVGTYDWLENPMLLIIIGVILLLLLILIIVLIIVLRRRKKKKQREAEEAAALLAAAEVPVQEKNPEIQKIQNEKSQVLRDSIRDFTEQNPEIAAQLLKDWLNGGDSGDG